MTTRPTSAARTPRVMERDIQNACTGYLELDGWRALRTDPVSDRRLGKGFGTIGMADHLYVRYALGGLLAMVDRSWNSDRYSDTHCHSMAQVMWIEWKRPKGKATQHQKDWHAAERARGALTLIAGEDFPASIEGFILWYEQSGLNRRIRADRRTA